MLAVEVRDPRELELPAMGVLALVDPETGRQIQADTRSRKLRERFAAAAAEERRQVAQLLRDARVDHVVLSTAGELAAAAGQAPGTGAAMTFQWPLVLLGLLIIPVLAAVYVLMQRRRTKYAVRFTNVDLLANVVSKTPSWRRHVPAVLLLLSTALLIFALARPRVEASTTREQGAIMLATDTSGSMTATDVKPDRMTAARNAAKQFVGKIPKQVRLGLVTFDQAARLLVNPTTDRTQVNDALDSLQAQGGTAMGDALSVSVKALQSAFGPKGLKVKPGQKRAPAEVVLLSDGKNTTGATDPIGVAQTAKKLGIRINTVALGTPTGTVQVQDNLGFTQTIQVPPDRPTLRQIAQTTGGRFFSAPNANHLQQIYKDLGSKVKAKPVKKEVSFVPAAAAIVLMLAAGGFSLLWFGRLP